MRRRLHLEISTKCLLTCPACPRTQYKGEITIAEMPLSQLERIAQTRDTFDAILLCGNHGDAIYHSRFHEIIECLKQVHGHPPLEIATNGSHRDSDWWKRTAQLLRPDDRVIFGIDGLKDTLRNYRRGARWDSIAEAIQILKRESSCIVMWQWILFSFNEHQLRDAMKQAREWGVDEILLVKSYRDESEPLRLTLDQAEQELLHG